METENAVQLAHSLWRQMISAGDTVIDATCGNGKDTLLLAELVGPEGTVHACDIQQEAIARAQERLEGYGNVQWHLGSHETLPTDRATLITYNLGYLPGGDKSVTTMTASTLTSVENALAIGAYVCIVCYPGHDEGLAEQQALLEMVADLDQSCWRVVHHQWLNRRRAPSLLFLARS